MAIQTVGASCRLEGDAQGTAMAWTPRRAPPACDQGALPPLGRTPAQGWHHLLCRGARGASALPKGWLGDPSPAFEQSTVAGAG